MSVGAGGALEPPRAFFERVRQCDQLGYEQDWTKRPIDRPFAICIGRVFILMTATSFRSQP